jgi:predicted ATP-dependent protease
VSEGAASTLAERRRDLQVSPEELRNDCPAAAVGAVVAEPLQIAAAVQPRALAALELGLVLRTPGYHVFVSGPEGTGRSTTVSALLERIARDLPAPRDQAYVHRFDDPDRPQLLTLPAGRARMLATALDEVREELRTRIPALLENRELEQRREAVSQRYARENDEDFMRLREGLTELGMGLVQVAIGPGLLMPEVAPLRGSEPIPPDEFEASLPEAERGPFRRRLQEAQHRVREHARATRERQRAFAREVRALVADAAEALVAEELRPLRADFADPEVSAFLAAVERDAIETAVALGETQSAEMLMFRLSRYCVNVVADRSDLAGAPVLVEDYPTHRNLVGAVERVAGAGPFAWTADASTIRAGSLIRADGGFLVVRAADVLAEPGAWDALRRVALSGGLELGSASIGMLGLPRSLEPDPIPLDVKLVLIGDQRVHDLLYALDPEFRKLFGVRAEFGADAPRDAETIGSYASVVATACERDGLPPADADAVAALVDEGAVLAGRADRLTVRFSEIVGLLREAAHWTRRRGGERIERRDVEDAVTHRRERDGAPEQRLRELLLDGTLLIATSGSSIGQVNGLSVYDLGYTTFGKPTRITASASPGRAGIVNVEREARLSGGVYDKGVMIIGGYLRRLHADCGPLALTASLTFEQSYAGVDGDSASIAEVVALVSELAGMPVDNRVAITGSINQHGQVQPVGGVNDKVRAWHALCSARGGDDHAVIIPAANVRDLMLDRELCEHVRAERFRVFGVHHVDDAIEIALGLPRAQIHAAVRTRLRLFADSLSDEWAPPEAGMLDGRPSDLQPPQGT